MTRHFRMTSYKAKKLNLLFKKEIWKFQFLIFLFIMEAENIKLIKDEDDNLNVDNEEIEEIDFAKANRKGAFFNVSNCAVGAGILSLPYAFETMGIIQATFIFSIFAVVTCLTLQILPLCAKAVGAKSYEEMIQKAFGSIVTKIFQVIVILYSFGVITGYIVIIGDLLPPIISNWAGKDYPNDYWYFSKVFYQVTITICILLPLACLKRLDSLKFASMFAICSVIYFTLLVVVESAIDFDGYKERGEVQSTGETIGESIVWWNWSTDIFLGIPIMAFAFGGHLQAISIYSELHPNHRTLSNWSIIAILAVLFLSTIYLVVGALSYLRFLPGEDGNVLEQMLLSEPDNIAIQFATIAMVIVVTLSFPLFTWPMRYSLDRLIFYKWISLYDPSPEANTLKVKIRYYGLTLSIIFFSLLVATLVGSLEVVFGLTGATGGALIKFIFPAACYWKLGPVYRAKFSDKNAKLPLWHVISCVVIIIVSAIVGLISSVTVLIDAYQNL